MSLWSLADEPTAIIMNHFYQFLKKGLSKDVALQQAKLQYFIHQGFSTRTPLNWSSFVIIGDTNPIATQTTSDYWKYAAIFLALFFFVILFYRLKQKAITDPPL